MYGHPSLLTLDTYHSNEVDVNYDYYKTLSKHSKVLHLEILDGIKTAISRDSGVTDEISPETGVDNDWNVFLWEWYDNNAEDLEDFTLIGYNMRPRRTIHYGHSLELTSLTSHFYVSLIIHNNTSVLGWQQTKFVAMMMGFPVVPELSLENDISKLDIKLLDHKLHWLIDSSSPLGSLEEHTGKEVNVKGVLSRPTCSFPITSLKSDCIKFELNLRQSYVKSSIRKIKKSP